MIILSTVTIDPREAQKSFDFIFCLGIIVIHHNYINCSCIIQIKSKELLVKLPISSV